ncbi:[histone H3]-lysine(4) N-trimethyltransferase [Salvia divinorum]|uniref:[histone H3]-lysine(4) N-trimethyltransferase n=1 Tax=Salvia divinorum TaxID=28513 RepID=A0ABD1FKW9_SALDI
MVSCSNGSLPNEVSNKRPLENGGMPKYKPRKVSSVRDFPPRCGPNAVPVNSRPEEAFCSKVAGSRDAQGAVNLELTNTMLECQSREEVSSPTSSTPRHHAGGNGSIDAPMTETFDTLMKKAKENVAFSMKLVKEIGSVGTKITDDDQSHRQQAVYNPVEIERDKQLGTYVGNVETTVINSVMDEVQEVMLESDLVGVDIVKDINTLDQSGDRSLLEELKEDIGVSSFPKSSIEVTKSLGDPLEFSSICGSIQPGTSIRQRDKYRPRRVSAVRDFPPHCGINVSLLIEKEKGVAGLGKDSLNKTEEVELTPEAIMSTDASEREITSEMPMAFKECLDGLYNVSVEIEESGTLNGSAGRELLGEMTVATAEGDMMGFEEYNRDLQHVITETNGASPGSDSMSKAKALVNTRIEDVGGSVGKEVATFSPDRNDKDMAPHSDITSRNEVNREVVHGLMAAPYCPWRKSKASLNSPNGGTDGLKRRKQNVSLQKKPEAYTLNTNVEANSSGYPSPKNKRPVSHDRDKTHGKSTFINEGDHHAGHKGIHEATPISMFKADVDSSDNDSVEPIRKNVVDCSPGDSDQGMNLHNAFGSKDVVDKEVVHGLTAAPNCPWKKEKTIVNSNGRTSGAKKRKPNLSWRQKFKAVAIKSKPEMKSPGLSSKKKNKVHMSNDVNEGPDTSALGDDGDFATNSSVSRNLEEFEISFPRFGPKSSGHGDDRNRVRETLRLFNASCRKLLQREEEEEEEEEGNLVEGGEEGRSKQSGRKVRRIDLMASQALKTNGKYVNTTKRIGAVPGVEVGDEFQYRVELAVVGIHFPFQSGIDSMKVDELLLATSIVTSGAYQDDAENADVLRYCGQGGNVIGKSKQPEDQKLERGNLALKNCIDKKTPVRVVRGWKEMVRVDPLDSKPKMVTSYVYDGLYTVTDCCTEKGPHGKQVFMFELRRNPGQPDLAWKELKKSSKSKVRPGLCVTDISCGKERIPIWAVNTIDDGKPPAFNYISKMMYPDWYSPNPPEGCNCVGQCSASKKCACAHRNGGAIPYNHNGALVETKTLVYECGPHCKCPPSCYNKATQRGIKFQLEIFKTEYRGWGVRALSSIPSGSFICEYVGELLDDIEAEERIGNDEYLFDIGQNLIDSPANSDDEEMTAELKGGGCTIDALTYGNVGRFINHSCAPNLWAQNVIYDNDDKRMPHVMLFAMENIPPLQELTYSYNYSLGQIRDSEGNVKVKNCYCGAAGCNGRLY